MKQLCDNISWVLLSGRENIVIIEKFTKKLHDPNNPPQWRIILGMCNDIAWYFIFVNYQWYPTTYMQCDWNLVMSWLYFNSLAIVAWMYLGNVKKRNGKNWKRFFVWSVSDFFWHIICSIWLIYWFFVLYYNCSFAEFICIAINDNVYESYVVATWLVGKRQKANQINFA